MITERGVKLVVQTKIAMDAARVSIRIMPNQKGERVWVCQYRAYGAEMHRDQHPVITVNTSAQLQVH